MSEFPGNKIGRGNPFEGDGVERPGRTRQLVFKSKSREEEAAEEKNSGDLKRQPCPFKCVLISAGP